MGKCIKCREETKLKQGVVFVCDHCLKHENDSSDVAMLIKQAECVTGVSYENMKKKTRKPNIVEARYYAMKLLREAEVGSFSFIGDLFQLDHSTVIRGIKRINMLIETKQVKYERKTLD